MAELNLFTPELLEAVEALALRVRHLKRGLLHGEHRARESGRGIEFREHRAYTPGDDLTRVDWNVYRRSARLYSRLADELREVPVRIHLDASASLWQGSPRRAEAARVAAFALAAVAGVHGDQVTAFLSGAENSEPLMVRGKAGLLAWAERLAAARPLPRTDLPHCIASTVRRRAGLTVLISDFYEPQGLPALMQALSSSRERLLLVRVCTESERRGGDPEQTGLTLVDCESGEQFAVDVDAEALRQYRARFAEFEQGFEAMVQELQAASLVLDAESAVLPQLEQLFPDGSLVL